MDKEALRELAEDLAMNHEYCPKDVILKASDALLNLLAEIQAHARAAIEANLASVQANVPDVDSAYVAGWVTAAKWASREDLISDIGSDAFERDRQEAFRRLSAIPKG